jgi:hypothetical protein
LGAVEAVVVPASYRWIRYRFVEKERGLAVALYVTGAKLDARLFHREASSYSRKDGPVRILQLQRHNHHRGFAIACTELIGARASPLDTALLFAAVSRRPHPHWLANCRKPGSYEAPGEI